jgi:CRISPR-associated protein Cas1
MAHPDEQTGEVLHLFAAVCGWENLLEAWSRVERNEGVAGVDGVTLDRFELQLGENLEALQRDLREKRYLPQPLLRFWATKLDGGRRPLAIPTVRDRIAQTAVGLVITPLLDREFESASYGFRRGRSVQQAVERVQACYQAGFLWVVDADIESFFDEVDHALLLARFQESILDPDLLGLVRAWLTTPVREGTELHVPSKGLPQGSPISPVLANLYLDHFDEALLRHGLKLVRFADDFLVLCRSRPQAEAAFELTENLLHEFCLSLDREKSRVTSFDRGFRYLGHAFLKSLAVPSPNRLYYAFHEANPAPAMPHVALTPGPQPSSAPRAVTPEATRLPDSALGRALSAALHAAHMDDLLTLSANAAAPHPSSQQVVAPPADTPSRASSSQPPGASPIPCAAADEVAAPLFQSTIGNQQSATKATSSVAKAVIPAKAGIQTVSSSAAQSAPPEPSGSSPPSPPPAAPSAPPLTTHLRRTLYIQEQGSVLARSDERLLVKKDDEVLLEVPIAKVDQIFIFGRCSLTTPAMAFCLERRVPVVLLSNHGDYYGMLESPLGEHVTLHRQQFLRAGDAAFCLATARSLVRGKLLNCRVLLERYARRKPSDVLEVAAKELKQIHDSLAAAQSVEQVYGYEGRGAACYFEAFAQLLEADLGFTHRVRRPPTDPVNSLLSFGYALCYYNLEALIRGHGLHPYVGHLHALRDGHAALASDLIEEFRAPVVDSLVLYLVNSRLLTAKDFYRPSSDPAAACLLRDDGRKVFLKHFELRMADSITHPLLRQSVSWRRAMEAQVVHMAQWIKGEVAEYQPLLTR